MNLNELTIKGFKEGLSNKDFSVSEVVKELLDLIEEKNKSLNVYLNVFNKDALTLSEKIDSFLEKGEDLPFLAGVPLAIKDNLLIEDFPMTCASKMLKDYISSYDATVIKKLKDKKAVFLGKVNLDEFAMGASTENSFFGPTRNPHDLSRAPGGSSGGSAAAVAAGLAIAALGSDTGGSIRQPAAFCGVVGFKPTYGAVSRFGLVPLASSLDQIGPITKTVEDAEIVFDAIKGKDKLDSTSIEISEGKPTKNPKDMVVGIPREYFEKGLSKEVERGVSEAIERIKKSGVMVKEISLPHTKYALSCYYIVMPAEASANLARYDGVRYSRSEKDLNSLKDLYLKVREEGFGPEPKRRILLGTFVLSSGYYDAYYAKAQRVRKLISDDFKKVFSSSGPGVDVVLAPTTPTEAFKIGEKKDPLSMYMSDILTIPANLSGLPALALPVKRYHLGSGELPVGFQLIGKRFHDKEIIGFGKYYEQL